MARPKEKGLRYYPLDVDIFHDEKMQLMFSRYGLKGDAIVIRLYNLIYKQGAFMHWNKDSEALFLNSLAKQIKLPQLREILNSLLEYNVFDKNLFEKFSVLTSSGIQKRYELIRKIQKRENDIPADFLLIQEKPPNDEELFPEKGGENKIKENKLNIKRKDFPEKSGKNPDLKNQNKTYEYGGTDADYQEAGRKLLEAANGHK